MATYTTAQYRNEAAVKAPVAPYNYLLITHTLTSALANGTSDTLRVAKLPKGVTVIPEECRVGAFGDPDSANNATYSSISLALDSAGDPYVGACRTNGITAEDRALFLRQPATSWLMETVATNGSRPSLALDAFNVPSATFEKPKSVSFRRFPGNRMKLSGLMSQ